MSTVKQRPASSAVPPRRRFAKWVALLLAAPLLLLSGYIGAWLAYTWWWSSSFAMSTIPNGNVVILTLRGGYAIPQLFGPIHRYIATGQPGAELLSAMQNEVIRRARPAPLQPPRPEPPVKEAIDRLLRDVPE